MKLPVYNTEGKEIKQIELQDDLFALPWNDDLIYQTVLALESNKRQPVAHTKDRSEVRGGGKKPWKQKGTGRARHGSIRSPLWKGGGVTFGPRNEKDYSRKLNKKVKAKALAIVISQKIRDNEVLFVEGFDLKEPKTKEAKAVIKNLSSVKGFEKVATKRKNAAVIGLNEKNSNVEKSLANFSNYKVDEIRNINVLDVLKNKYLLILNPEQSLQILTERINVTKK